MLEKLEVKEWLKLNAGLQQKKNKLREELASRGVLVKKGSNTYDKYKYFSEAQYKELFTELMSKHRLEMSFREKDYLTFEASGKNSNGRLTKLEFYLYDVDTGFYETSVITGEGADKGDKGGYKAYTGALKYFLADTFMVATGDDAEKDSPAEKMTKIDDPKIGKEQLEMLRSFADQVEISAETICQTFKVESLTELTMTQWTRATQLLEKEAERKGVKF